MRRSASANLPVAVVAVWRSSTHSGYGGHKVRMAGWYYLGTT